MSIKINRYYNKISQHTKRDIDNDFDSIDDLLVKLEKSTDNPDIKIIHEPIEDAFKTRLEVILYQNNLRAFYLLTGIVTELNNNNLPATLPLIRAFFELMIQLGYLCNQILNNDDLNYLISEPFHKIFLGNKNNGAGVFAIGNVESINILTMINHAERLFNSLSKESSEEKILTNFYADISNKCHPNFNSNMFFTSFNDDGKLLTLSDIRENMETIKSLAYNEYMPILICAIELYCLYIDKINQDKKVQN